MADLAFRIEIPNPAASELFVQLRIPVQGPDARPTQASERELVVFMPTWTPGSYLIREYSRHVANVRASDGHRDTALTIRKTTKNRWSVSLTPETEVVRIEYSVYCHELSVRTADVTPEHAFWNNACVLLWPLHRRDASADITVRVPEQWAVSTTLPAVGAPTHKEAGYTDVHLHASDMDRAFDCPILAGSLRLLSWSTLGVKHTLAIDGLGGIEPPEGIVVDLGRVVESAARIFGGKLPYREYVFLCLLAQDGHGGLEHSDSTTLIHSRTGLRIRKGYLDFLSLAAHELFHAWNAKRIHPSEFREFDYESETYTEFLWLIEGWTAYYDDLICVRAGLFSVNEYLAAAAKNVQGVLANPGRLRMSLAESSFDAWIRLYRPDENTRNSSQNYYGNGAVAAMCLDLLIRSESAGRRSLDDIIRELGERCPPHLGYGLEDVLTCVENVGGAKARSFLLSATREPLDPPMTALLATHGVSLTFKDADQAHLGLQFEAGGTVVGSATRHCAAWNAGIMPGDEVLAVNGLRVDATRWSEIFHSVARPHEPLDVLLSRRGVIQKVTAIPGRSPGTATLEIMPSVADHIRQLRDDWLLSKTATTQ